MSNHSSGHKAERRAAKYLKEHDYKILSINWRTRYCEIDIVAQKASIVYLVEVKYRLSDTFGTGLEYITAKKLKQMSFAAELWASSNRWEGDFQLSAIEVTGSEYEVKKFLPLI